MARKSKKQIDKEKKESEENAAAVKQPNAPPYRRYYGAKSV